MSQQPSNKNGKSLEVVRGGLSPIRGRRRGPRIKTPEELTLERRLRPAWAAFQTPEGRAPSRGFYDAQEGVQHPLSTFARRMMEARQARVRKAHADRLCQELQAWVDEVWQDDNGAPPLVA